jgi:predicted DNA-binding transcriptional regulator AlpA
MSKSDRAAYTIDEFCAAHGICRKTFYNLEKDGKGPRRMQVGARVLISIEAAADWRREREQATEKAA